jgi:hypothetical protein
MDYPDLSFQPAGENDIKKQISHFVRNDRKVNLIYLVFEIRKLKFV